MIKRKPATPLPDTRDVWRCDPVSALWDAPEVRRRWNAYPRLVAALRALTVASEKTLAHCPDMEWRTDCHKNTVESAALLRELGEQ